MAGGLNGQPGEQGAEPESAGWGDRTYDDAYSLMLSGSLLHDSRGECAGGSAGGHALQVRAAITQPMFGAIANITIATSSSASAPSITGRLPT